MARRKTPITVDNARFFLLAALILLYLVCGAAIFSALERPFELRARRLWTRQLANFTQRYGVDPAALRGLLRHYEDANGAGVRVDALRPRWDFSGAFYFVATVVSTIGFGMTTPVTVWGKIFLIFYGLIGCASTILFFNLFLERIITTLAYIMRWCHQRRLWSSASAQAAAESEGRDGLEGWKPSVYYVMLILGVASAVVACGASTLYSSMEKWSYVDSLYFCFVVFSTIGFGDLVSSQRQNYSSQEAYRLGNCFFILAGVCCIYSLFNVISIVIKQTLNWILEKICYGGERRRGRRKRRVASANRSKRNAVGPGSPETAYLGRRLSGEMRCVNELVVSNKVSLALLEKQLSESVHQNRFSRGVGVGALAIMENRLQETSFDR
ncbi:potassium channel subfamily K member 13 [Stigmatopora nigra]